jgi:hypothetical protein
MSVLLTILGSIWGRLAATLANTAALGFLGPLAPIIAGIGQFIGAVISAIGEILASLSKSAEGRVFLCLLAALIGFLYLRFHYIEEGKATERAKIATAHKSCPASRTERRGR